MVSEQSLPFLTRLWFSYVVFFRVLFNGSYAFALHTAGPALPEALDRTRALGEGKSRAAEREAARASSTSAAKAAPEAERAREPERPKLDAALQLLALLQREGRFVDFLEEEVASFSDADIGAAARVVHAGCRKALREHVKLQPVRDEEEGAKVTLPSGFSPAEVKLTGNVQGTAPYTGVLRHRGWRAAEVSLPSAVDGHDARILAQAEVEV